MRAIITHHPSCEVTRIETLSDQTIFHLETGQSLRVGMTPSILGAKLKIDLSQSPSSLRTDIFCHPFMSRSVWEVVAPIVRAHPDIQRAFDGHPQLQALGRLSYDEVLELPLRVYITQALYLTHPFNFVCKATNPKLVPQTTDYWCDFMDGDYLVKVVVDLQSRVVTVR